MGDSTEPDHLRDEDIRHGGKEIEIVTDLVLDHPLREMTVEVRMVTIIGDAGRRLHEHQVLDPTPRLGDRPLPTRIDQLQLRLKQGRRRTRLATIVATGVGLLDATTTDRETHLHPRLWLIVKCPNRQQQHHPQGQRVTEMQVMIVDHHLDLHEAITHRLRLLRLVDQQ